MSREMGHDAIAVRVLAHQDLGNRAQPRISTENQILHREIPNFLTQGWLCEVSQSQSHYMAAEHQQSLGILSDTETRDLL